MRIERVWAMPNKWTFQIKPIAKLLRQEMSDGTWIDPYAGMYSPATITNDINPKMPTKYHLDALEFAKQFGDNSVDGIILDPPYSYRQISEHYKEQGLQVTRHTTSSNFYFRVKKELAKVVRQNGKVISCAWNSNGMNNKRNFKIERILIIAHGGHHNDTIVTVERKMNGSLF